MSLQTTTIEKVFLLILASCICQAQDEPSNLEWEWSFEKSTLFSYDRNLGKIPETFVYAYCNASLDDPKVRNDCTFVLQDLRSGDRKSCRMRLNASVDEGFNFLIERFSNKEVLVVRLELGENNETFLKYSLLDMGSCNVVDSPRRFADADWMQSVTYRDSFDVISRSDKCAPSKLCRVTSNDRDQTVGVAPFPEYLNPDLVIPVSDDAPQDGFFVAGHQRGSHVVVHVAESGKTTGLLFSHPLDQVNRCRYTSRSVAGGFGVCCDVSPTEMRCTQFRRKEADQDGWVNSSVEMEKLQVMALQKDPEDEGLLLLTSVCVDELDLSFCKNTSVIKIHDNGRKEVLFEFGAEPTFTCETYDELTSVEIVHLPDRTKGFCVDIAYVCYVQTKENYRSVLKLSRKCQNRKTR